LHRRRRRGANHTWPALLHMCVIQPCPVPSATASRTGRGFVGVRLRFPSWLPLDPGFHPRPVKDTMVNMLKFVKPSIAAAALDGLHVAPVHDMKRVGVTDRCHGPADLATGPGRQCRAPGQCRKNQCNCECEFPVPTHVCSLQSTSPDRAMGA
jgi:hypothetical protein